MCSRHFGLPTAYRALKFLWVHLTRSLGAWEEIFDTYLFFIINSKVQYFRFDLTFLYFKFYLRAWFSHSVCGGIENWCCRFFLINFWIKSYIYFIVQGEQVPNYLITDKTYLKKKKKTLWVFFVHFFPDFWLEFLSKNRLYKNVNFLKKN